MHDTTTKSPAKFPCSPNGLSRRGAMLPFIAMCLIVLFAAVTLSVDVARIHVTRAELRTATDAAARAGAEALGRRQDAQAAIDAAIALAARNTVAGRPLTIRANQVEVGTATSSNGSRFEFVPNGPIPNAIRVTGSRQNGSPDGPVGLLFGPIFGVSQFEPIQTSSAIRTDRDIALVLDVSGSMASNGGIEALRTAVTAFMQELQRTPQQEHVSLTVYSTTATKRVSLTPDTDLIARTIARERPNGLTAIGLGLQTGINSILTDAQARPFALKTIVVMTDGVHNTGINPVTVAQGAPSNITIHTVTLGTATNRALMRDVARPSRGTALHAESAAQLEQAFREIARQLTVLLIE